MKFAVKAKCPPTIKKTIINLNNKNNKDLKNHLPNITTATATTTTTTIIIVKIIKKITGPDNKGFKKKHLQNVPPSLDFLRTGQQKKMSRIFSKVS
jgi:hypothetical protein